MAETEEDEESLMVNSLHALGQLPTDVHWFCPLFGDVIKDGEVPIKKEEPDASESGAASLARNPESRLSAFRSCLRLFSYVGEEVEPYKQTIQRGVDRDLSRCDACIAGYYKSKHQWLEEMRRDNDQDTLAEMIRLLDDLDFARIDRRLDNIKRTWQPTDPTKAIDEIALVAPSLSLIDALSCEAYLADPDRKQKHFDDPCKSFVANRPLKIRYYVPGATSLLFDTDTALSEWAVSVWSAYSSNLTQRDFDFAVKGPFSRLLTGEAVNPSNETVIERVWEGVLAIFERLDSNLITHSFRAMEVDVFKLSLEHLRYDAPGLRYLLQALARFLELAPKDYWDSMGHISPPTVTEAVFNNKQFDKLLRQLCQPSDDTKNESNILGWMRPFVASLQPMDQARACRSLTSYLLDKFQSDEFPQATRNACFRAGLLIIKWTSLNCNREHPMLSRPIGRMVAAELLEVISTYIRRILSIPTLAKNDPLRGLCSKTCFDVVELALTLDCKCLRTDQETLRKDSDIEPGTCSYATTIWEAIAKKLDCQNLQLAEAALSGINGLTGLEKFETRKDPAHKNLKSDFNVRLGHFTHLVCLMLERINDLDPADLDELFQNPKTATGLIAALFSPDASTYEAGVNLLKSISTESARKDAIRHVLTPYFETTMDSFSRSLRRLAQTRTYASCPRMLKTCGDVFGILCDSQTGLLRTRQLQNAKEVKALENFWEHQWMVLTMIYEMTESWGRDQVADSDTLKEFVRNTMDFSEQVFDQYGIFASAVNSATTIKIEDGTNASAGDSVAKKLLSPPAKNMTVIVKWLRLREMYLASMSVKLTIKVLGRLTENGMQLGKEPCDFVEIVVRGGKSGKTNLSLQEKAELGRALEANIGRSVDPTAYEYERSSTPESQSARQQSSLTTNKKAKAGIIDLDSWRSKSKPPAQVIEIEDDDEYGVSTTVAAGMRSMAQTMDTMNNTPLAKKLQSQKDEARNRMQKIVEQKAMAERKTEEKKKADSKSFSEKRKKEMEAKKKRDAEQIAMIRKRTTGKALDSDGKLGGLGIQGKDHAPKGSGVMISSGSESESEDEIDQTLFGGSTKALAPKISDAVRDYQNNRLKQLREPVPVKKTRQVRSAKDMRARLAPDLTALHKTILGWEYFHNGDFPPGSDRDDYSLVSNTFRTPNDYQSVFEPLLVLEAWQGFLKTKEESTYKNFDIKVATRLTVDSFVEVSTTIPASEGKELGIGEADVVLISKSPSPANDAQQPHCLARVYKINRKKATMDISYRVNIGNPLLPSMVPNATLYGVKILSLTPLEREYGALLGLKYFDLCDEIIKARPSPLLEYSSKQLGPLEGKYNVNTAQAKAIKSAIDNDAFTLIQGPPGSGKTKTIFAIVGALLSGQFEDKGTVIGRPQMSNGKTQQPEKPVVGKKKLLVCAPSNAAVDELVMRFKDGVKTLDGRSQKPAVVRLGKSDAINANVRDVTLEELVNDKLNLTKPKQNSKKEDIQQIYMAHKATSEELKVLRATMDSLKASGEPVPQEQAREFEILKRKQQQLGKRIDEAKDSGDTVARDAEISRRKVQQEIIDGAHIICATLSGSGHDMFQNLNIEFESVIIDEAAQSIELSALIPLKYGCAKCVLVGDPKQLPPTVLSREAARFQYEQSLFVRMQQNHPRDVHLLDTQYRMHPEISLFPSKEFYDGKLLDGGNMANIRTKPWHQSAILGPYRFFDVHGVQQSAPRGHSLINIAEIEMALKLFARLTTDCKGYDFKGKVSIITPYKSQLRELRSRFAQMYGEGIFSAVEFNTTDAFQGRESEIIIFSCVRASVSRGIGFLSDIRRMNVGITRARSSLWVLGNSQSLLQGEFWRRLIEDAKLRNRFSGAEVMEQLQRPLFKFDPKTITDGARSSVDSASTVSGDVDMPDAPPIPQKRPNQAIPSRSERIDTVSTVTLNGEPTQRIMKPSGGGNGLNPNAACAMCGSYAHMTFACDNPEARSFGKCHRCGDMDHRKDDCTKERCLECGQFGHSAPICTSAKILSKAEKEKVRATEASHRRSKQRERQPEVQKKRQLGEHAQDVPVVRATKKTPPPEGDKQASTNKSLKRRRDSSPPPMAPKGPKASSRDPRLSRPPHSEVPPTGPKGPKAGSGGLIASSGVFSSNSETSKPSGHQTKANPPLAHGRKAGAPNVPKSALPLRSPTLRPESSNLPSPTLNRSEQHIRQPPEPVRRDRPPAATTTQNPSGGADPARPVHALPDKPPARPAGAARPVIKKRKAANPFMVPDRKPKR